MPRSCCRALVALAAAAAAYAAVEDEEECAACMQPCMAGVSGEQTAYHCVRHSCCEPCGSCGEPAPPPTNGTGAANTSQPVDCQVCLSNCVAANPETNSDECLIACCSACNADCGGEGDGLCTECTTACDLSDDCSLASCCLVCEDVDCGADM